MRDSNRVTITAEDLLSIQQAARRLGRPRWTIYRWIGAGRIIAIKLGGFLFIPTSEVERLLAGVKAPE